MTTNDQHPIAVRRLQLDFTQEGLADEVGVDPRTVQRWEAGERKPQPWTRPKLAKVLRVTKEQLDTMIGWAPGGARALDVAADMGDGTRNEHGVPRAGSERPA